MDVERQVLAVVGRRLRRDEGGVGRGSRARHAEQVGDVVVVAISEGGEFGESGFGVGHVRSSVGSAQGRATAAECDDRRGKLDLVPKSVAVRRTGMREWG